MKNKNQKSLEALRHTAEHVLHTAMQNLYPKLKKAMGPATEDGFYFDFDLDEKISDADFPKIEAEMKKIIKKDLPLTKEIISVQKARKIFKGNEYKLDWVDRIEKRGEKVSIYKMGNDDLDLCSGPHVKSSGEVKAFKLLSVAGAYWHGDEKNKMLTRIYGTAFPSQKELDEYLTQQEEAQKRDHRKLGKELGFYLFTDSVGPGLPIYTPKAGVIIGEIENFMRQLQEKMGYGHVYTPHLAKEELYQISGHLQWFAEGMYPPMEFEGEGKYYAKPMNCPFHIQIYKMDRRSYRDLPIRYAEFGTVYRYEKSGEISGLMRTRGFTQDDAHIFCREDQIVDEFVKVFEFTNQLLTGLGLLDHWHRLSLRGEEKEKYAGNVKQWEKATTLIRKALEKAKIKFKEAPGEAAFYGPKLDILFNDSAGREVQISTIQIDFLLPDRFGLTYIDKDSQEKQPYMIHRAPLGSRERIMAILLEHYLGAFPVWLSPVQVKVLPITEKNIGYAEDISSKLKAESIRTELDDRNETLPAKIRDAQMEKVPYMLIVGDKEASSPEGFKPGGKNLVAVRLRSEKDLGQMSLSKFIERVKEKIDKKSLEL